MSQEQLLAGLTYLGLFIGLIINVGTVLRFRGQGRKDAADTYKSLTDALENSNEENDRLRKERTKYRKLLRDNGINPDNGNGK